jgi:hypothetical protein
MEGYHLVINSFVYYPTHAIPPSLVTSCWL